LVAVTTAIYIRAMLEKDSNNFPMGSLRRIMQGRPVIVVLGIRIRAALEKDLNNI